MMNELKTAFIVEKPDFYISFTFKEHTRKVYKDAKGQYVKLYKQKVYLDTLELTKDLGDGFAEFNWERFKF